MARGSTAADHLGRISAPTAGLLEVSVCDWADLWREATFGQRSRPSLSMDTYVPLRAPARDPLSLRQRRPDPWLSQTLRRLLRHPIRRMLFRAYLLESGASLWALPCRNLLYQA
jgi:hypothetical protein